MNQEQIQLCYAIFQGNTPLAQDLLRKVDVFEHDALGLNVASVVVAGLQMEPYESVLFLSVLFPDVRNPCPQGHLSWLCTAETFRATLRPLVRERDALICAVLVAYDCRHPLEAVIKNIALLGLTAFSSCSLLAHHEKSANPTFATFTEDLVLALTTPNSMLSSRLPAEILTTTSPPSLKDLASILHSGTAAYKSDSALVQACRNFIPEFKQRSLLQPEPLANPETSWAGLTPKCH